MWQLLGTCPAGQVEVQGNKSFAFDPHPSWRYIVDIQTNSPGGCGSIPVIRIEGRAYSKTWVVYSAVETGELIKC